MGILVELFIVAGIMFGIWSIYDIGKRQGETDERNKNWRN